MSKYEQSMVIIFFVPMQMV